jgi:hypothetical protein
VGSNPSQTHIKPHQTHLKLTSNGKSTANPHRTHIEPTSNPHRTHIEPTSNPPQTPRQTHGKPTSNSPQTHIKRQIHGKPTSTYIEPTSNLHRTRGKPTTDCVCEICASPNLQLFHITSKFFLHRYPNILHRYSSRFRKEGIIFGFKVCVCVFVFFLKFLRHVYPTHSDLMLCFCWLFSELFHVFTTFTHFLRILSDYFAFL